MLKFFTAIAVWIAITIPLPSQAAIGRPSVHIDLLYKNREVAGYTLPYHSSENNAFGGSITARQCLYGFDVEGSVYALRSTKPVIRLFESPQTRQHTMLSLSADKQFDTFMLGVRYTRMHTNMPEGWFFQGDASEISVRAFLLSDRWRPYAFISTISSSYFLIDKIVLACGAGVTTSIPVQEYGYFTVDAFAARSLFTLIWGKESVAKIRTTFTVNHKSLPVSLELGCNLLRHNSDNALWFDIVTSYFF